MERLWLHHNTLSGEIPPELGGLDNLEGLLLRGNQLTREIPSQLGDLENLEILSLERNKLSGCVPDDLRDQLIDSRGQLEVDADLGGMSFC